MPNTPKNNHHQYNWQNLKLVILVFFILSFIKIPATKAGLIDDIKQEIEERQKEIEKLEKQAESYKQSIKTKRLEKTNLKNQIFILDAQIEKLKIDIRIAESKIRETSLKISELNLNIDSQTKKIAKQKQALGEVIRTINEYDQETPLELILKNNNFSDFFNQMEYVGFLQKQVQVKLENIQALKIQLEKEKAETEKKKKELEDRRAQLTGLKQTTDNKKEEKEELLDLTQNQEWRYQNLLKETQAKREEIEKEIFELEDKLRNIIDPSSIPAPRSGVLEWPTGGLLTQRYGPTSQTGFQNHVYNFHNGIDIASGLGEPIKAAQDGIVKGTGDNGKYAYGKWLAIEHSNGLTTLYAHLSAFSVSYGQKVKRGEVIGYEGSTGFSTGPHLHFTVYATNTFKIENRWFGLLPLGGSINPMDYL